MKSASMLDKFYISQSGWLPRIVCMTLVLISISCLRSQKSPAQVEAIISPKSRICFNSMSTSFQSECVYCDSRLYTSTISACTGQPTLANNVTQAQAFCIATACLEVQVLNKADPFGLTNNLLTNNNMIKLNLLRPSQLFGGSFLPKNELKMAQQSQSKKFLPLNKFQASLRQEVIDKLVTDDVPSSNDPKIGASNEPFTTTTTTTTSTTSTTEKSSETKAEGTGGSITTSAATADPATQLPAIASESKRVEYPDFSKMHAKIYSTNLLLDQKKRNKLSWRPFPYYSLFNRQPYSMQRQQGLVANQMSQLIQTFSSRLAEKRANWWQTGKGPVMLGRRKKRSLLPSLSFNLTKNKQKLQNNGTVTAQLNKLVNGTTSGNLAFVLNKPSAAYIWSNPFTKVFTKNTPNKSLQWQFGKGQTVAAATAPAAGATATAGQMANPQSAIGRPASLMAAPAATSGLSPTMITTIRPQNWQMVPMNNLNTLPPRGSLAPAMAFASQPQQQFNNPTTASFMPQQQQQQQQVYTAAALANSGTSGGSYVELADDATISPGGARG